MKLPTAVNFIKSHDRFILTAHETPDGDALGSELAMSFALKSLGKEVKIINADPMPVKYSFIDPNDDVSTLKDSNLSNLKLENYVLIILDTNDINNIGNVSSLILPYVEDSFIIDHHENGETIISGNLVKEDASSTCEILYGLFKELNIELSLKICSALYVGIVYDTGSFIYPKTTAKTFHIAYDLVSRGVNPNYVYSKLYESNTISSLVLQSKVLSSLKLYYKDHVAVQTMRKETLAECGAFYEESDTLINIPLKSENIRVSIFFKENLEGLLRCSLRSKGNIDVVEIAQIFGGGGHKTAAGFKCKDSLDNTLSVVLDMLEKYFL